MECAGVHGKVLKFAQKYKWRVAPYTRIMAENDDLFLLAAERMRSNTGLSLNNEQKLKIYGYYKQVNLTLSHNETSSCTIGN